MSNKDNALEFAMALDKARLQKEDDIAEKVQEIAMDAFGMIIKRTPVDTGRLRSNWVASNTTPNTAKFEQVVNPHRQCRHCHFAVRPQKGHVDHYPK